MFFISKLGILSKLRKPDKPKKPKKPKKRKKKKMVDLLDRMTYDIEQTGRPKLDNHAFNGYLILYSLGLRSRTEVCDYWDLQGDELTDAIALADKIDSITDPTAKIAYCLRADAVALQLDAHNPEYVTSSGVLRSKVIADMGW